MSDPVTVLLVPPLSAYGGVASMTLYWRNIEESLRPLAGKDIQFRALTPPLSWRSSPLKRRICQRWVLPSIVRAAICSERRTGRRPVVHVLDQHYAHLLVPGEAGAITCHDLDLLVAPQNGFSKWEERWRTRKLARAGVIHAISENTARDVARFFPGKAHNVVVNYYGLDPAFRIRSALNNGAHLARLQTESGSVFVLHVGSNVERKNIRTLLKGFAEAKSRLPGHRLKLVKVGDDLQADGFGPMLQELGIAADVIFLGALTMEPLIDVYNACHVFAFPSRYEGFGRPVVEAQACGLPCILARASSLPEVGGEAALYHQVDDAGGMAAHLVNVAGNAGLHEQLKAAGLENVRRFSWRRHAELLKESYLRLAWAGPQAIA